MRPTRFNIAFALVLVFSVLLGACDKPVTTPAATTPKQEVTPAGSPASKPTVTPAGTQASKPAVTPAGTQASKPAPGPTRTPKPEKVTVLVASLGQEGFLPFNDNLNGYKLMPCYEAIWDTDPDTRELRPMLAESLPQWSEDNKTLNITLRQGVQFHDGWGEMTAEDVKFSIEMAGRKGSVSASASDFAAAKVEILGPYKLAVTLPAPNWSWAINNLSSGRFALPIVSKKYIEKEGELTASRRLVGTGPFKFVRHEVGLSLEFEAVPNHWRITPDYKTLVLKVITEPATIIAMLRTGEADIAAIPLSFVPEAKAAGLDIRLNRNVGVLGIGLGGQYLPSRDTLDPNVPWVLTKDPERALKVRKALNLAVNRQELIDKVLNGIGGPWPIIASPNVDASYDPSWKPYPYDPVEAKRLLAEAGYPDGFETSMVQFAATGQSYIEVAEAVAIYWEKIGIKVKRLPMDQPAHRTRQLGRKNAGVAFPVSRNFYDEDSINMNTHYSSTSTAQNVLFEYPQIDNLVVKASSEVNKEKRMAMAYEMHKIMYENYYAVPVSLVHMTIGVTKRIGDWQTLTGDPFISRFEYIKLK